MRFSVTLAVILGLAYLTHQASCPPNEEKSGDTCICKLGRIRFNGQCVKCPTPGRYSCKQKGCICAEGYSYFIKQNTCLSNSQIIQDPAPSNPCPQGQQLKSWGSCQCKQGYTKYDGVNCIKCPNRSWYDVNNKKCVCQWGLTLKSGQCIPI